MTEKLIEDIVGFHGGYGWDEWRWTYTTCSPRSLGWIMSWMNGIAAHNWRFVRADWIKMPYGYRISVVWAYQKSGWYWLAVENLDDPTKNVRLQVYPRMPWYMLCYLAMLWLFVKVEKV